MGKEKQQVPLRATLVILDSVHIACWAATQALSLDGDFVECGIGHGLLSKTIVEYLDFSKAQKVFILFDTYIGIPLEQGKASEKENMQRLNETHYAESYFEKVASLFRTFQTLNWFEASSLKVLKSKTLI